jgi:beta-lactamase regulating signal transducer with metallopeptidase domain
MDAFWVIVASNAVVATILAIGSMLLSRIWKNAAAVHTLWLVVLLKLFTPPLVTAELPFVHSFLPSGASADSHEETLSSPAQDEAGRTAPPALTNFPGAIAAGNPQRAPGNRFVESAGHTPWSLSTILAAIWILGIGGMALGYAIRIRRFATAIRDFEAAPPDIGTMVSQLSNLLGLRRVPDVRMTSRALPPLVWSMGSSPCVILPSELFARLSSEAQRTILAHELCHIRRGDHLVRLLELAATTVFWWHPVVWWARWQLRELEEQCCDGRVLELVPEQPRTYAAALVDTLEFLSERPRASLPLRTAVYSTGSLSRRIRMLTQRRTYRLGILSATLVAGLVALPLVVAFAVDPEPTSKNTPTLSDEPSRSVQAAVLRGRVTDEAGAPLADVRVRVAIPAANMRLVDASSPHKRQEARTDASGDYRLEFPGITERTTISIDAMKPGYRRLVGTFMSGGDEKSVEVAPGEAAEASLTLKPAAYFAGIVVNELGRPIPGAKIVARSTFGNSYGFVETTASESNGSFELFNYSVTPRARLGEVSKGAVSFDHPDYIGSNIEDVYSLAEEGREALRIVLATGHKVAGTVFDVRGKPVPDVMIKATREDRANRKATMTDANGRFTLRGLADGLTTLSTRALDIKQKINLALAVNSDTNDLEVRLQPMSLPADLKKHTVLGMQLTDVTPELKSAYDLYHERGALILDPGKDSDRLGIGRLAEGYCFFVVGKPGSRIGSVREFVNQVLAETAGQDAEEYSVRVVYSFSTLKVDGTNTQYLKLTRDDLKQLQTVSDQLRAESR